MTWLDRLLDREETVHTNAEKQAVRVTASPVHHATMPKKRIVAMFQPTLDFMGYDLDGNLLGSYRRGKTYYIREGNSMLADLCQTWEGEGKITISGG